MKRTLVSSGSYLEPIIGMSRAVRTGPYVSVAGTAPIAAGGGTEAPGDVAAQTRRCIEISLDALKEAGARPEDVVRTRLLLTDIKDWEIATRVHGEFFSDIRPVCTVMEVNAFVEPDWLVETEMDAIISEDKAE